MSDTVSAREAARLLGVSDTAIRKRIANGSVRAQKRNGTWQIPHSEVARLRESICERSREPEPSANPKVRSPRPEPEPLHTAESDAALWELPRLREERDELRAEVKRLHARLEHLEAMNERLTLLLANEQARRLHALPRPLSWIARLLGRRDG